MWCSRPLVKSIRRSRSTWKTPTGSASVNRAISSSRARSSSSRSSESASHGRMTVKIPGSSGSSRRFAFCASIQHHPPSAVRKRPRQVCVDPGASIIENHARDRPGQVVGVDEGRRGRVQHLIGSPAQNLDDRFLDLCDQGSLVTDQTTGRRPRFHLGWLFPHEVAIRPI